MVGVEGGWWECRGMVRGGGGMVGVEGEWELEEGGW